MIISSESTPNRTDSTRGEEDNSFITWIGDDEIIKIVIQYVKGYAFRNHSSITNMCIVLEFFSFTPIEIINQLREWLRNNKNIELEARYESTDLSPEFCGFLTFLGGLCLSSVYGLLRLCCFY